MRDSQNQDTHLHLLMKKVSLGSPPNYSHRIPKRDYNFLTIHMGRFHKKNKKVNSNVIEQIGQNRIDDITATATTSSTKAISRICKAPLYFKSNRLINSSSFLFNCSLYSIPFR